MPLFFYFFLNFLFCIGVQLINNVVSVSGVQQSNSVIHIHISILLQILFPFRLLQNTEQSSPYYTVGPFWLSILNIAVCTCQYQTPNLSLPHTLPPVTISSYSKSVSLLLFFFLNLFIYGCVGSSFLCEGFLQLRQVGATLHRGARASHYRGLSCCGAQAPAAQAQ